MSDATPGAVGGDAADQKVRRLEQRLAGAEALYRGLFDNAADAILVADEDGHYVDVNQRAVELLGWSRDELLSKRIADIVAAGSDWTQDEFDRFTAAGSWRGELDLLRSDGDIITVESNASTVELPDRTLHVAILRDITDRVTIRRLQAEMLATEQQARRVAEEAWERLSLVSEISELLSEWTDYPAALTRLAAVLTRRSADICVIDLLDEHGRLQRAAAVHADPKQQHLVDRLSAVLPLDNDDHPAVMVIRSRQPVHAASVEEQLVEAVTSDAEERELVRQLGYRSFVSAPLIARDRVLGAISLVSTTPGHRFTLDDVPALEEIARRAAVRIDNARLYAERDEIASALQTALLPARLPHVTGVELAARYETAGRGQVGGDFYDVIELPDSSLLVVVGDVCGKGPQAAAVTGLARHTVRAVSARETNPARILRSLNSVLVGDEGSRRFITACCVRVSPERRSADVCTAGHPPPLLVHGGQASVADVPTGLLLGEFADAELESATLPLAPGDGLLLFTDGLLGGGGDIDALAETVTVGDEQLTARSLVDAAMQSPVRMPPRPEQADDIAVVALVVTD